MIKRLLLLNGLAAFGVAMYHASAYGMDAMFLWTNRYLPVTVPNYDQLGSQSYYGLLAIRQLCSFVIPAFIFISGYFVAFSAQGPKGMPWNLVRVRIQTLLVPFILWTGFRFVLLQNIPDNLDDILSPYYYIVLVIQFYLLSPFLIRPAKENWKLFLLLATLVQIGAESIFFLSAIGIENELTVQMAEWLPLWFFPRRIFWFALGIVFGFHRKLILEWLTNYKWILLGGTIILAGLTIVEYNFFARLAGEPWLGPSFRGISSRLFAISFILCFLVIDQISLPLTKQLIELGSNSFGIYLMNIPVIYVVGMLLYRLAPWVLSNQLVYQAILISTGLVVPLMVMHIASKSPARRYYHYIFG